MRCLPILAVLVFSVGVVKADEPKPAPTPIAVTVPTRTEPISYAGEVAEVFDGKCIGCHNSAMMESKLSLEDVPSMLKGGKHGPAIVAGKADESLLFKMAAHRVEPVMPPKDKKDNPPLSPEELGLLKLWIDAGAKDDSDTLAEPPKPIELGSLPPGVQPIVAVDLTADGKRIAAGRANLVQVYDADSGLEIVSLAGHKDIIQSIRFSSDGTKLAAGGYQIVTLWNLPTGGEAKTFTGSADQIKAVVVAPDGKTIYSSGLDRSIRLWNPDDGKETRRIEHPAAQVFALALAPGGQSLATGGADGIVRIINLADGKETLALKGHTGPVNGVAFLPDGKRLASVSADGTGRIWTVPDTPDAAPAEPIVLNGHAGAVHAVAVTPDGQTIITGGLDKTIRLWLTADGKAGAVLSGHGDAVLTLAVSPKGDLLLSGSSDKTAYVFKLADGSLVRTLTGHAGAVQGVAFSPDGARMVTAGSVGGLKVWEVESGQGVIAFGHNAPNNQAIQPIQAIAFLNNGTLVSGSADKTLKTWTFSGAWSESKPLGPHAFRVLTLDFNPDGTLLATGGGEPSRSGEVKIWEVGKGILAKTLPDSLHSDTVFGVRFSPDGSKLATCAADKFLKVTDVASGKVLKTFEGHTHHVLAVDWRDNG
ncbi:MAG: c-type cytochrome domain-containing protein, partial [Isosphaeraceae bacterium]